MHPCLLYSFYKIKNEIIEITLGSDICSYYICTADYIHITWYTFWIKIHNILNTLRPMHFRHRLPWEHTYIIGKIKPVT